MRAGSYEVTLASKQGDGPSTETRKERRPIHIHTTKVLSHALAQELRSRAHTLVTSEAAES